MQSWRSLPGIGVPVATSVGVDGGAVDNRVLVLRVRVGASVATGSAAGAGFTRA